jgi:hypothetical protein
MYIDVLLIQLVPHPILLDCTLGSTTNVTAFGYTTIERLHRNMHFLQMLEMFFVTYYIRSAKFFIGIFFANERKHP